LQDCLSDYQKFTVLDEVKTRIFIDKNFNTIGMKRLDMERFKDTEIFMTLVDILRESEIEQKQIPENVKSALDDYNSCFFKNNFFDYSMIMERAMHHLETDMVLKEKISKRIKYLIVDEYQKDYDYPSSQRA